MHYLIPYRKGTSLTSYLRLPRFLVSMSLSNDAKLLYTLLLDRAGISAENGFTELDGTIHLYFTLNEAKEKLHKNRQVAPRAFHELEQSGLIVRKKQGLGRPAIITLSMPQEESK